MLPRDTNTGHPFTFTPCQEYDFWPSEATDGFGKKIVFLNETRSKDFAFIKQAQNSIFTKIEPSDSKDFVDYIEKLAAVTPYSCHLFWEGVKEWNKLCVQLIGTKEKVAKLDSKLDADTFQWGNSDQGGKNRPTFSSSGLALTQSEIDDHHLTLKNQRSETILKQRMIQSRAVDLAWKWEASLLSFTFMNADGTEETIRSLEDRSHLIDTGENRGRS